MVELKGLSLAEAKAKQAEGLDNSYKVDASKSTWEIIRENTFTLFNAINFFIAFCLIAVQSYMNALFILFIINNIVVGIIVEIRARNIVDKLTLLNKEPVRVIRGGEEFRIDPDEIVLGDLLKLSTGDQIPSDAIVKQGFIEVNEALLTGESDLVTKKPDTHLLSGSFVSSGQCLAVVEHVGKDSYSTKLAIEAKVHKPLNSELLNSLKTITKFTSRVVLPLGIILLLESLFMRHAGIQLSVVTTASAMLGMLPKGMAVLIVISLITAVIKLGRKKVLVQEMYSIETMAHIDTLCLDKTGTITRGEMRVSKCDVLGDYSRQDVIGLMGAYMKNSSDNDSTTLALRAYFAENEAYKASKTVSFSSQRKWSAMHFKDVGTLVLGAPEKLTDKLPTKVTKAQAEGSRVLLLGITSHVLTGASELKDITPIAMIALEDSVRKDAKKTLRYLNDQGVDLKIISGDNPATVSVIAKKAGFKNHTQYVDASTLSDAELKDIVADTAIFGRVSPGQKKLIVGFLKSNGKKVAMTGDGVNDILAFREADLSIAMATGDAATKQIANLVLLESDFTDLPHVLFEARRVVNNMFRAAAVFFIKTIYSFLLVILSALSGLTANVAVFPFLAIQITLADQVIEGWPSFWLSFENDRSPISKNFLKTSLLRALPNALLIAACVVFIHFYGPAQGWGQLETTTLMFYLLGAITIFNVIKACLPLNKLRIFLIGSTIVGFYTAAILFHSFVKIGFLTTNTAGIFVILLGISAVIRVGTYKVFKV
ncbi:cation-translocating P-type ATPase [Candidatus Saccharibacteria bacterium]|nr:cation-translocating P-type ATPase [Candidatus Saccharibacteria bacterium]